MRGLLCPRLFHEEGEEDRIQAFASSVLVDVSAWCSHTFPVYSRLFAAFFRSSLRPMHYSRTHPRLIFLAFVLVLSSSSLLLFSFM